MLYLISIFSICISLCTYASDSSILQSLHAAIESHAYRQATILIEKHNAPIFEYGPTTSLHLICNQQYNYRTPVNFKSPLPLLRLLLQKDKSLDNNCPNRMGHYPLDIAAFTLNYPMIPLLIKYGAHYQQIIPILIQYLF